MLKKVLKKVHKKVCTLLKVPKKVPKNAFPKISAKKALFLALLGVRNLYDVRHLGMVEQII